MKDNTWKIGDRGLPLKEIDKQMALFDKEYEK